jgi:hypothetical protein
LATHQTVNDESLIRKSFLVGLAGFEPATSCPPDKHANQAALQPAS